MGLYRVIVKVGNKIYDAEKEPIMIVLSKKDKENITNMSPELTKYCAFPKNMDDGVIEEFMKVNE